MLWFCERGFQIRSDTIHLPVALPGNGGAPLITHVLPHLVALSRDPQAPDINCIAAAWLSGAVIDGQYREQWFISCFMHLPTAAYCTWKEDMLLREKVWRGLNPPMEGTQRRLRPWVLMDMVYRTLKSVLCVAFPLFFSRSRSLRSSL